jgi:hypothetical protein
MRNPPTLCGLQIIDRIDYNMEKTAEQTQQGREELRKAERSHRRSPAMCVVLSTCVVYHASVCALDTLCCAHRLCAPQLHAPALACCPTRRAPCGASCIASSIAIARTSRA